MPVVVFPNIYYLLNAPEAGSLLLCCLIWGSREFFFFYLDTPRMSPRLVL